MEDAIACSATATGIGAAFEVSAGPFVSGNRLTVTLSVAIRGSAACVSVRVGLSADVVVTVVVSLA